MLFLVNTSTYLYVKNLIPMKRFLNFIVMFIKGLNYLENYVMGNILYDC